MKQEVLSELHQMKYLFGYKAGKVISEQVKPEVPVEPTAPYKLIVIKSPKDFEEFVNVETEKLKPTGIFAQITSDYQKSKRGIEDRNLYVQKAKEMGKLLMPILRHAAVEGLNGLKIKEMDDNSLLNLLKGVESPEGSQMTPAQMVETYFANLGNLKNTAANVVDFRIKQMGGDPNKI